MRIGGWRYERGRREVGLRSNYSKCINYRILRQFWNKPWTHSIKAKVTLSYACLEYQFRSCFFSSFSGCIGLKLSHLGKEVWFGFTIIRKDFRKFGSLCSFARILLSTFAAERDWWAVLIVFPLFLLRYRYICRDILISLLFFLWDWPGFFFFRLLFGFYTGFATLSFSLGFVNGVYELFFNFLFFEMFITLLTFFFLLF